MTEDQARDLLGLPASYSSHDVKEAWRAAARRWHPDRVEAHHRQQAAETFTQLQQAYLLLMAEAKSRSHNPGQGPSSDSVNSHDPFAWFDGPTRPGPDLHVTLAVPLADLMRTNPEPLTTVVTYPVPCPNCQGVGCRQCEDGAVDRQFRFTTPVPQGLTGSTTVTKPRRGVPGWGGGPPGDAHVTFDIVCGSSWTIDNAVPVGTVVLSTAQYLAGGQGVVTTPDGREVRFAVPGKPMRVRVDNVGMITPSGRGPVLVDVQVRPLDVSAPAVRSALQVLHEAEGGVGPVSDDSH